MNGDENLENAVINSLKNPRHCLFYEDTNDKTKIAKTLVNSNEIYELKIKKKYQKCIQRHEENHVIACLQTHFRRMIIIESLRFPFEFLKDEKWSQNYEKIEKIYNCEIYPLLEAFALFHQIKIAPPDLREQLIAEAHKEPSLFERLRCLEELLNKTMEKNAAHTSNPFVVLGNLASVTFSSLDMQQDRVTDRLKLLGKIDIPSWEKESDLMRYIIDIFHKNGLRIIQTSYGTTESVFGAAIFLRAVKNIFKAISSAFQGHVEDYVLSILSEIDPQIGPVSYTCSSLDTLEDKKLNYCYLGAIAKGKDFFTPIEVTRTVMQDLLSRKLDAEDKQLLLEYDEDLNKLVSLKKDFFQKCPGPECCQGKTECALRSELGRKAVNLILLSNDGKKK